MNIKISLFGIMIVLFLSLIGCSNTDTNVTDSSNVLHTEEYIAETVEELTKLDGASVFVSSVSNQNILLTIENHTNQTILYGKYEIDRKTEQGWIAMEYLPGVVIADVLYSIAPEEQKQDNFQYQNIYTSLERGSYRLRILSVSYEGDKPPYNHCMSCEFTVE